MKRFLSASKSALLLSIFILWSLTAFILAQDEVGFNYIRGSDKGPENWGSLNASWTTCNTGERQSPINLPLLIPQTAPNTQQILESYQPAQAILNNERSDVELKWQGGAGKIQINGVDYLLDNFHWHTPSEHVILGIRFAAEIHLVHKSSAGNITVIGILYTYGSPDPFLAQFEQELEVLASNATQREVDAGIIDPKTVWTVERSKYYRYNGSLTTPPCTEGVLWTVNKQVATISTAQVALLKRAVRDGFEKNARPLQPLNGRRVDLYYQPSIPKD